MRDRTFLALCLLILVNQLGFGIITPVLPAYGRSFGVGASAVGLILGIYGLARFIANVPAGHLAERRGRRTVLGIITPSGESLALTPRLLSGLARRPLWLFGTARVALESGETIRMPRGGDLGDTPLTTVLMHVEGLHQYAPGAQRVVEVEATVIANALIQPLVVLTTDRPASWPL